MDETQVLENVYMNETYLPEAAQPPRYDGEEMPQADLLCEGVPPLPLMFGARSAARAGTSARVQGRTHAPRGAHRRVGAPR
jgi:hypothetical protein